MGCAWLGPVCLSKQEENIDSFEIHFILSVFSEGSNEVNVNVKYLFGLDK
jgi:hypothetical protein